MKMESLIWKIKFSPKLFGKFEIIWIKKSSPSFNYRASHIKDDTLYFHEYKKINHFGPKSVGCIMYEIVNFYSCKIWQIVGKLLLLLLLWKSWNKVPQGKDKTKTQRSPREASPTGND